MRSFHFPFPPLISTTLAKLLPLVWIFCFADQRFRRYWRKGLAVRLNYAQNSSIVSSFQFPPFVGPLFSGAHFFVTITLGDFHSCSWTGSGVSAEKKVVLNTDISWSWFLLHQKDNCHKPITNTQVSQQEIHRVAPKKGSSLIVAIPQNPFWVKLPSNITPQP